MRYEEEFYSAHNQYEDATSEGNECFIFIRTQQNMLYKTSVQLGTRHKNLRTR